ncbi:hypothetical protein QIS74_00983 [Colletotrichum tabaci]|uniref:NACHT domain-containing protein n=1 Tax=Colletotrichum tabaci TaxID=1209068 RepID=A0AAV9TVN5_9PEZI
MTLIKEKLRAPEYYLDQEVAAGKREGLDTGRWVFEESQYTSWSDHTVPAHSILYLNGIPGAGKTTLVSSIISRLLEVQSSKSLLPHSVAYFYFKHGNSEKNNHDSFLRAVLTQLISQDTATSQEFFEKLSSQADVNIRSRESLQTLTKSALEEYRVSFLVLDGLDECDREQANVTVKWLLSLLDDDRYERITASIYESEHESERETAQKIIALVVTAKRDLKWREIQSFFCIDSSNGTVDPDERLQVKAKDLCGSLVDVHPINGQASEHEYAVRIVHDTARR